MPAKERNVTQVGTHACSKGRSALLTLTWALRRITIIFLLRRTKRSRRHHRWKVITSSWKFQEHLRRHCQSAARRWRCEARPFSCARRERDGEIKEKLLLLYTSLCNVQRYIPVYFSLTQHSLSQFKNESKDVLCSDLFQSIGHCSSE